MATEKTIRIAAAAIVNEDRQMLLVRKSGTSAFMQPGGKIDEGETPLDALVRELHEELDLRIDPDEAALVGTFCAEAANEPDHRVEATVYRLTCTTPLAPQAEIEELKWYPGEFAEDSSLAPLTRDHVIPAIGS